MEIRTMNTSAASLHPDKEMTSIWAKNSRLHNKIR